MKKMNLKKIKINKKCNSRQNHYSINNISNRIFIKLLKKQIQDKNNRIYYLNSIIIPLNLEKLIPVTI